MRSCKYLVIDYAHDEITPITFPFLVLFIYQNPLNYFVQSIVLSEWKGELHIDDHRVARYVGDFIAEIRQLNYMTEDARTVFLELVDGMSAGVLRTTSDGFCQIPDFTLLDPTLKWDVEQVGCPLEVFRRLLAQLLGV